MNAANDIRETREKQGVEESVYYILKDHLGSWTTITDADGNVEQELSYDAWGNLLASKSTATLSKETKVSMRHTKDVIDNKGIPGSKNFANFSAGLISGQAKEVINSPNSKSTSSNPPPMILAPTEEDEKEHSFYQMIIYRTGDY